MFTRIYQKFAILCEAPFACGCYPPVTRSQTKRATNCATSRNIKLKIENGKLQILLSGHFCGQSAFNTIFERENIAEKVNGEEGRLEEQRSALITILHFPVQDYTIKRVICQAVCLQKLSVGIKAFSVQHFLEKPLQYPPSYAILIKIHFE